MGEIQYSDRVLDGDRQEEAPDRQVASSNFAGRCLLQQPSRILALQQTTSPSSSFSSAIDHVHHPAPQVTRCCLRCPQLLSLVHLPCPRIRDDLRGGRREQTFRLRLCHRPSCRTHGNQLRIQQEDPTSRCTLFRTQPEIQCSSLPILYVP